MKRRTFIQLSTLGGLTFPGLTLSGCLDSPPYEGANSTHISTFELDEITVEALQQAMEAGKFSARTITEKYLARIREVDRGPDGLNAVIELNPEALDIADKLDQERAEGQVRGPLHGIPVLIKDNIDTADQMMTTAGALALKGNIARQDSWVAERLRAAGAIILGKTNLSEWANFRSTRSSSGWSSRGGQTRNPYVLNCNTSGSSAGSGAAVAANLCTLAIGTETNGSVISPSSICGIVGIKPTVGLVGRSGIIPISHTQDTAGPMARTVRDAAVLLGALVGTDPRDRATATSEGYAHTDYTTFLQTEGLKGARIGVDRSAFGFHEGVDEVMEAAMERMRDQGATLIELERVYEGNTGDDEFLILLYEFKDGVNKYLKDAANEVAVHSLKEVIDFNLTYAEENLPWFGQEILVMAEEKGELTSPEYLDALENVHRLTRKEGIDKVVAEHQLDAILAPAEGPGWTIDKVNGDRYISGGSGYGTAAMAGYPNITVPAGAVHGLPVGVCLYGKAWSEPILLKLAYAFEQASPHRKIPTFLKHL